MGGRVWAAAPNSGTVNVKTEPFSGAVFTSRRPPCARTIRSQM
jgi:hypothetical protein